MIRITSITIREFRGIRDLTLDFNNKNYAVCGKNGTGKSGVVDAVEFVLTGDVSRLSGEGMGGVSLKNHGPHVDKRSDPSKATVKATIHIPSLNKSATIERNLKNPKAASITPPDADIQAVVQRLEEHPEVVLSRRELIKYVLATPGKRSEEVQALLHLDQVEQTRASLAKISNACIKDFEQRKADVANTYENLTRALGITELTKEKVLEATNQQRAALGLPPLTELTATTSLKDGLDAPIPAKAQPVNKTQANADLQSVLELLSEIKGPLSAKTKSILDRLSALAADPELLAGATRESFYQSGLNLVTDSTCPFCDNTWDPAKLKAHVNTKILKLKEFSAKKACLQKEAVQLIAAFRRIKASLDTISRHATFLSTPLNLPTALEYAEFCQEAASQMGSLMPIDKSIKAIEKASTIPASAEAELATFAKAIATLPDPSKRDDARSWLTVANERLEVWRDSMRKQKIAKDKADKAKLISDLFTTTSDSVLGGIYNTVQDEFAKLYSFINQDDESGFKAKLTPSMGKLGFDVDFYGRGYFPPGAYHSEGHQDGMGLCLYLALMKHLQGAGFTFAVLDDVLMSVDAGHRREVCAMLKKSFPDTQFIITTHDAIWLRHMKTESLITGKAGMQFRSWSVDQGPTQWKEKDTWSEINEILKSGDVRPAAALLRHYLEYVSAELCHHLRAPVEFRGDAQYQLGELLPSAIKHLRHLYRKAKESANSWDQKEVIATIATKEAELDKKAQASNADQWQVNVAVHYNSWDTLTSKDFIPVAEAYKALLQEFCCPSCNEHLYVSPDRETPEMLRCNCGKTSLNLKKK